MLSATQTDPSACTGRSYSLTYLKSYKCIDTRNLNPVSGALSVFSDFYAVILPMGMLRHFDAPKRQKMALNGVFSLGLFVVAFGCVRTYYIYQLGFSYDIPWVGYDLFVWSILEIQVALICASAPALRVFFREYLSDPLSRAIHSARSVTSSARNTNRESRQSANGVVSYSSHNRDVSRGSSEYGDKKLIQHNVKPSLSTVGETELESGSPSITARSPSESYPIRTPADFEAFALQNLEKNRPPRPTFLRPPSDYDMHESLQRPFTDWYSPPRSRG